MDRTPCSEHDTNPLPRRTGLDSRLSPGETSIQRLGGRLADARFDDRRRLGRPFCLGTLIAGPGTSGFVPKDTFRDETS